MILSAVGIGDLFSRMVYFPKPILRAFFVSKQRQHYFLLFIEVLEWTFSSLNLDIPLL